MANPKDLSLLNTAADVEKRFLAGPRDRAKDLESAIRYFLEFLRGFETLGDIDRPCVTVFGSARLGEGTPYYDMARALGRRLAEEGLAVMTGGGPGRATETLSLYVHRLAFRFFDIGQASAAAIEHLRRSLSGHGDKVFDIFADHGNQIAASMPTALTRAIETGRVLRGNHVLLVGTAAGVSLGGAVLRY